MADVNVKPITIKAPSIKGIDSFETKTTTPEITNWGKSEYKPGKPSLNVPASLVDPVISTPAMKLPPKAEMTSKIGFDRETILNIVKQAHLEGMQAISIDGIKIATKLWTRGYDINE